MKALTRLLDKAKTEADIDRYIKHIHRWIPYTPISRLEEIAKPYRQKLKNAADKKDTTGKKEAKA